MSTLPESLAKLLAKSEQYKRENKKFLTNLARRRDIDTLFHTRHEEVFAKLDCLECANCCKTTSPIFRDVDIERISKHLGMKPSHFTEKYLHIDDENDYVLNSVPCAFLGEDNYCTIYEHRPKACREYPHTDRKNMGGIMDLTYKNTLICPAVVRIVDSIKKALVPVK